MKDEGIHNRIEQLVAEEHELYERGAEGGLSESLRCRTRHRVATTEVEPWKLNNFFSGSPE